MPKAIENVNEFLFRVNAQFRVNVACIAFHGVFGSMQLLADVAFAATLGQVKGHIGFTIRQIKLRLNLAAPFAQVVFVRYVHELFVRSCAVGIRGGFFDVICLCCGSRFPFNFIG